jgi:hypothetical protein
LETDLAAVAMVGGSSFVGQPRKSFGSQVGKLQIHL